MDPERFDGLTQMLGRAVSRRRTFAGVLSGLLLPFEAAARKQGNGKQRKSTRKGNGKQRVTAQDTCWRAGACIPKKGANVSQCDLADTFFPSDCTGCNVSRANLRGVNAQFVNFTRANLSGSCLVDADFTGATFANNSNLYNAIFCRTIMPDGSTNNSGCGSGTACCPTCLAGGEACGAGIGGACCSGTCTNGSCQTCTPTTCQSLGKACGTWPDGCGGTVFCGTCSLAGTTPACNDGICATCAATCPASCFACLYLTDGSTECRGQGTVVCNAPCSSNADCPANAPLCIMGGTSRSTGVNTSVSASCAGTPAACGFAPTCGVARDRASGMGIAGDIVLLP